MTYDELFEQHRVRAVVAQALVGEITPEMRAVSVQHRPHRIDVWFYTDGPASKELQAALSAGARDLILEEYQDTADCEVCFHFARCDYPAKVECQGAWIYGRREYQWPNTSLEPTPTAP